jgi:methylenetetrahydrofolate dehydrogenase (NADP+)/methenyltetrahydrofolate cyclohydrolase
MKAQAAEQIGLKFNMVEMEGYVQTDDVVLKLKTIQENPHLAGLIIQLPLPMQLSKTEIVNSIGEYVDVDCLSGINSEFFYAGHRKLMPPTAAAVLTILKSLKLNLKKLKILVIGQGELVGKPVTFLLNQEGYNVEVADSSTDNLKEVTLTADVIISATGHAKLITGEMVKPGATLIDCGTAESNGGIVGDLDMASVSAKAGIISAVPGGVGPVTVARLLYNVVQAAKQK